MYLQADDVNSTDQLGFGTVNLLLRAPKCVFVCEAVNVSGSQLKRRKSFVFKQLSAGGTAARQREGGELLTKSLCVCVH